jgi:hypothetical protein
LALSGEGKELSLCIGEKLRKLYPRLQENNLSVAALEKKPPSFRFETWFLDSAIS